MKESKQVLRLLMMAMMIVTSDTVSLSEIMSPLPTMFNLNSSIACLAVFLSIVCLAIFLSMLLHMNYPSSGNEEPEPVAETQPVAMCYDTVKVYEFLCKCVQEANDLLYDCETKRNDFSENERHDVSTILAALLELYNEFEENGLVKEKVDEMLFLHESLQKHGDEFNAFTRKYGECIDLQSDPDEPEPTAEDLIPLDVPESFLWEELAPPFQPRSPEHMCLWMINRLTSRITACMKNGLYKQVRKNTARRQIMVSVCKLCKQNPTLRHRAQWMMMHITDVSDSDDDDAHDSDES